MARVVLTSRKVKFRRYDTGRHSLVILGNGPSLRKNIDENLQLLQRCDTLAVNFAASTPEFSLLKPRYYVLADPHFFKNADDVNVLALMSALQRVDWDMTLFVPAKAVKQAKVQLNNPKLTVAGFNMVALDGWPAVTFGLIKRQCGMPRPRNVLIPSIMIGIWLGYKHVVILGADHSWLKTLSVDNDNKVVSVQPHFYKDNPDELERITRVYDSRRLHEVLESICIAFRSYHSIEAFAASQGVEVINATPDSFIDAFAREDADAALTKAATPHNLQHNGLPHNSI